MSRLRDKKGEAQMTLHISDKKFHQDEKRRGSWRPRSPPCGLLYTPPRLTLTSYATLIFSSNGGAGMASWQDSVHPTQDLFLLLQINFSIRLFSS